MAQNPLSFDADGNKSQPFKFERNYLKDQVTDLLRDYLIGGRIAVGTKLVERDVAEQLGISRAPVRDALMELEKEGLVVSKPNGRYVIEPTGHDVKELYQVRLVLEKLAIELCIQHRTSEDCLALSRKLAEMKEAVAKNDRLAFARSDVELHDLIWRQSGNHHLQKILSTMSGAIFLFAANNADYYDWDEAYQLHEDLVHDINTGNVEAALKSLECHVEKTIQRLLGLYH